MRHPPRFLQEDQAEELQGTTTRCAGMNTSCGVMEKGAGMSCQVGTTGNERRVWQSANWRWMTKIGGMNHAEDEEGSARG
jgi:hypothetical protein